MQRQILSGKDKRILANPEVVQMQVFFHAASKSLESFNVFQLCVQHFFKIGFKKFCYATVN
jgi:hypothetical protein